MNLILTAMVVISVVRTALPDTVLYSHMDDGSTITLSDAEAPECGQEYYRASRENSDGYSIDGCWIPDFHSDDVEIFLPSQEKLIIPKDVFLPAQFLPCETDSQCEGLGDA